MSQKTRFGTTSAATLALLLAGATPALAGDPVPDVTPPVIVSTGLTDGQLVPAIGFFFPTITDDVGVTKVTAALNGDSRLGSCSYSLSHVLDCRGLFTNLPHADGSDADVTLRAYDRAGNESAPVTTRVHIDAIAPKATITPAAGSSMRSGPVTFTLSGLSDDVARVDMIGSGENNGAVTASRTSAPWTFDWTATEDAAAPHFWVVDRAGNRTYAGGGYIVSDQPPVIGPAVSIAEYMTTNLDGGDGWVGAEGGINATVTSKAPIARFELWVDGVLAYTHTGRDTEIAAGWHNPPGTTSAQVELRVWDAAGNEATKTYRVHVDTLPPAVTVTPGNRALVRGSHFITTAKATDPHGIGFLTLTSPYLAPNPMISQATVASGPDGNRYVTWMASDRLGNQVTVRRLVIVDNTPPAVSFGTAPANHSLLRSPVKITATAGDRNGIARVQMLVDGRVVSTDGKAGYTFTLNPRSYSKTFTVRLRAYDNAGNLRYSTERQYRR